MKRLLAVAIVWTGLAVPLLAAAQNGTMMGGDRGASMMGGDRGVSMMGGDRAASMMGGKPGMQSMPAAMSEGEVRKVDSAAGKLTLRHGGLANLNMPEMTMVFRVRDPTWLTQLMVGDKVRFVAQRVDGNVTVTALEPEQE